MDRLPFVLWRSTTKRGLYGGDSVIVTEDLNDEFDVFKRKVFPYLDDALRRVRSIDLLNIWIRESNVSVKSLQVLENTYNLMSPLNLDDFCQWVLDARKSFTDKSVNKYTLQRFREQLLDETYTASCFSGNCEWGRNGKYKLLIGM